MLNVEVGGSTIRQLLLCLCLVSVIDLIGSTEIECIPLKECPMAMSLVRTKKYEQKTIDFLKNSHCGMNGREPMVFCPKFNLCFTPDYKNGTCAHLHNCKTLVRIIENLNLEYPQLLPFLEEYRCDYGNDSDIKVCCPPEEYDDFDGNNIDSTNEVLIKSDVTPTKRSILPDSNKLECGLQISESNRITGGTKTQLGEFPWMALLIYQTTSNFKPGCGGSLINSKYVLTAAHCLQEDFIREFKLVKLDHIVLGEYDTNNKTDCIYDECADPPKIYTIKSIKVHERFTAQYALNDIGLVELNEKVTYTDYIKPICLMGRDMLLYGNETFVISGWGQTLTALTSPIKLKARVKYSAPDLCKKLNENFTMASGQICAGVGNGIDTCRGDSGGPLMLGKVVGTNFIYFLAGVISYGYGNCGAGPSVYTYIPSYIDWISDNVR